MATNEQLVRRSERVRTQSTRLSEYDMFPDSAMTEEHDLLEQVMLAEVEPADLSQALTDPNWLAAMKEELQSIEKNKSWELVEKLEGEKSINVKWVFKVKMNPYGEIAK